MSTMMQKKIQKSLWLLLWLTGMLLFQACGHTPTDADSVEKQPIDVRHISYQRIEANLHASKSIADSPYY